MLDTLGMFELAYGLPEQVAEAAAALEGGIVGLPSHDMVSAVLVLGMGGSGVSGDVLAAVAGPECPVPIVVSKDYELPGFVDGSTLVLAVSCSGNTEETLEAVMAAHETDAYVATVSQGGRLAELAS